MRGSRSATVAEDVDMSEVPMVSTSSFAGMPTPSSFSTNYTNDTVVDGLPNGYASGKEYYPRFDMKHADDL